MVLGDALTAPEILIKKVAENFIDPQTRKAHGKALEALKLEDGDSRVTNGIAKSIERDSWKEHLRGLIHEKKCTIDMLLTGLLANNIFGELDETVSEKVFVPNPYFGWDISEKFNGQSVDTSNEYMETHNKSVASSQSLNSAMKAAKKVKEFVKDYMCRTTEESSEKKRAEERFSFTLSGFEMKKIMVTSLIITWNEEQRETDPEDQLYEDEPMMPRVFRGILGGGRSVFMRRFKEQVCKEESEMKMKNFIKGNGGGAFGKGGQKGGAAAGAGGKGKPGWVCERWFKGQWCDQQRCGREHKVENFDRAKKIAGALRLSKSEQEIRCIVANKTGRPLRKVVGAKGVSFLPSNNEFGKGKNGWGEMGQHQLGQHQQFLQSLGLQNASQKAILDQEEEGAENISGFESVSGLEYKPEAKRARINPGAMPKGILKNA